MIRRFLAFGILLFILSLTGVQAGDKIDMSQVENLIKQLDDDSFDKREDASKQLEEISLKYPEDMFIVLSERVDSKEEVSLEVRMRLERLLSSLEQGKWVMLPDAPIKSRYQHSAIWTGSQMIIWGGAESYVESCHDGAFYDLKSNHWERIASTKIKKRNSHHAFWAGGPAKNGPPAGEAGTGKMIVWGGAIKKKIYEDGAIYDLNKDEWNMDIQALDKINYYSAVWTGSGFIIWGGQIKYKSVNYGMYYDLKKNEWESIPQAPIKGRYYHSAIWTGDPAEGGMGKMIVWGGYDTSKSVAHFDGAIYDLKEKRWEKIPDAPISQGRYYHTALWTGDPAKDGPPAGEAGTGKMIIWGGISVGNKQFNNGLIYDSKENKWSIISEAPIKGRYYHTAVWTGDSMIVWGGGLGEIYNDGAIYSLKRNKWYKMAQSPLKARQYHSAIWTGREMIIWGGKSGGSVFSDGAIYKPLINKK